jgi:hypothetical protein
VSCRPLARAARLGALLCLALAGGALAPAPLAAEELPTQFREAVALFLAGDYKACQLAFGRAVAESPRAGLAARAAYGAACCAAVRNDVDGGFEALGLALDNGFIDLERALTDPRLETLRADPRWVRLVALLEERQQAHQKTLDPDLLRLYLEQQSERGAVQRDLPGAGAQNRPAGPPDAAFVERGQARRKAAWELVEKGRVRQPDDAFHAAALLVESDRPAEVERAGELARQALARNPDLLAARPLVATAADRKEMLAGRPQKFGTQLVEVDGKWRVYEVDPAVTDDERAEWGLPPLAEALARAAELNRPADPAPASPPASSPAPTPPK